jgi:LuxR family maltose regulon positive regulatory protein
MGGYARRTHGPERVATGAAGLPLLASKLAIPPVPSGMLIRPRLEFVLDAAVRRPVTVVSAPPGCGKTTLLAMWASSTVLGWPIAWVTLDAADRGERFWQYLHAALMGTPLADWADTGEPGPDAAYLTRTADALARLTGPVVLILDDFHQVTDSVALAGLSFIVRHAGGKLRLVLSTRIDPAFTLPIQRWRIQDELAELPAGDLAFTSAEIAQLIDREQYDLSQAQRAILQTRTEGWPAGLRLAALALRQSEDRDRDIQQFSGGRGDVAEYLVEEVHRGQPPEIQEALADSSILGRLCGELLDALTGRDDGARVLAALEHANSFIVANGGEPGWYRHHRLFRDFLFAELLLEAPQRIGELHRRAAAWHGSQGSPLLAMRHALAGQDWPGAVAVLAANWEELGLDPDTESLWPVPEPPPHEAIRADPHLALAFAADRIAMRDAGGAETYLRLAGGHRHLAAPEYADRFALIISALQLACGRLRGDPAAARPVGARRTIEADAGLAAEVLSERELTVLHYLQSPLSNAEIAGQLTVSVHTVKTHVRNIYRKLGVARRREAIRRARHLNLL